MTLRRAYEWNDDFTIRVGLEFVSSSGSSTKLDMVVDLAVHSEDSLLVVAYERLSTSVYRPLSQDMSAIVEEKRHEFTDRHRRWPNVRGREYSAFRRNSPTNPGHGGAASSRVRGNENARRRAVRCRELQGCHTLLGIVERGVKQRFAGETGS